MAQVLQASIAPLMENHGFKTVKKDGSFKKRTKEAEQHLYFNIVDHFPRYVVEFFFRVKPVYAAPLQAVAEQAAAWGYSLDMEQAARQAGVAAFGSQPHLNGRSEVDSVSSLKAWAARLADFLAAAVLPVADRCDTIESLDALVNANPPSSSPFKKLASGAALAYAAKNPRFEELAAEWVQSKPAGPARVKIQGLIAELKRLEQP